METVQRYYYQITQGCNTQCSILFCKSNPSFPNVPKDVALVLAHSIFGRAGKQYLCPDIPATIPSIAEFSAKLNIPESTASKLDVILSNCLNTSLSELGLYYEAPNIKPNAIGNRLKTSSIDHLLKAHFSEALFDKILTIQPSKSPYNPSPDSHASSNIVPIIPIVPASTLNYDSSNPMIFDLPSNSSISIHSHRPSISPMIPVNISNIRRRSTTCSHNKFDAYKSMEYPEQFIKSFIPDIPTVINSAVIQKMIDSLSQDFFKTRNVAKIGNNRQKKSTHRSKSLTALKSFSKLSNIDVNHIKSLLSAAIHVLFSDPLIMLNSFTTSSSKINYTDLLVCYDIIANSNLVTVLNDALSSLLSSLKTSLYKDHSLMYMIVYMVSIYPHVNSSNLLIAVIKCYNNATTQQQSKYKNMLTTNKPHLRTVVAMVNEYITSQYENSLHNNNEYSKGLTQALLFIKSIYVATEYNDIQLFYNESLGNLVDFKNNTDLGAYLFLFDCVAKTRLYQMQSLSQMTNEYENAIVNHSFIVHASRILEESITINELDKLLAQLSNPYCLLEIKRDTLLQDIISYKQYILANYKKPLRIRFDIEQGLDQGGVQKELFLMFIKSVMDPDLGLFVSTRTSHWLRHDADLEMIEMVGIMMGLAGYNGIILDYRLPVAIFKKLNKEELKMDDFIEIFPDMGKGLLMLLSEDVTDLELCFDVSYDTIYGIKTYELINNGSNTKVTNGNKQEYIELFIQHKMNVGVESQFEKLYDGFWRTSGLILKEFRGTELSKILMGSPALDFKELEKHVQYEGYSPEQRYIRYFLFT
eukprot:NODE_217_length_14216_cov_0.430545.p1 type:complete len:811 gc:universal NODE_217_length_14216_cov_0.430545:12470-10038(-)